ncbi:MAG: hypothetical protein GDA67_05905 [Nitrospira sp. CR1.3]|nr:hypothetical protein [Nitrospira sp. CR1.3]
MSHWRDAVRAATHAIGAAILLLGTVTGCDTNRASGPYFDDIIHPRFDDTVVYFYRVAGPEVPKSSDWIYAFNKTIRLDDGGYTFQVVPPGRYLISLYSKADADDLWFDLKAGQTAFFKWGYVSTGDRYGSKVIPVDQTQALKELPNCRLMQLDPGGRP